MNTNNLRTLALLLRTHVVQKHFNMRYYTNYDPVQDYPAEIPLESYNECGTAACALGHAPLAFKPEKGENWPEYCERVFGIEVTDDAWDFLFSSLWENVDNTPLGAAKRIEYLINHDCPARDDIYAMFRGEKELVYA